VATPCDAVIGRVDQLTSIANRSPRSLDATIDDVARSGAFTDLVTVIPLVRSDSVTSVEQCAGPDCAQVSPAIMYRKAGTIGGALSMLALISASQHGEGN